jgi:hypothetical protein
MWSFDGRFGCVNFGNDFGWGVTHRVELRLFLLLLL